MREESTLGSHRRSDGIAGTRKGHKEGIPPRIHFMAVVCLEYGTQQATTLFQHSSIVLADPLEQVRRFLYISKEQGDGARR
jgi:hypothetical protein